MKYRVLATLLLLGGCGGNGQNETLSDAVVQDVSGTYTLDVNAYTLNCTNATVPIGATSTTIDIAQTGEIVTGFIDAASPLIPFEGGIDRAGDFIIRRTFTASNGIEITNALDGSFFDTGWAGTLFSLSDDCAGSAIFGGDLL